jgi:glutaredoxin
MTKWRSYLVLFVAGVVLAFGAATRTDAAGWEEFGRCLTRQGATFYGASWCPHCRAQRATLGDAMSHVRYVECSVDGQRARAPACKEADVDSYPTWVFTDGSRAHGEQSLARLAAKTGCELPAGSKSDGARAIADPDARPRTHGPKIIEVPY